MPGGYADDTRLSVRRRTHALYTVDPVDFGRWTLERLAWRGSERVLDVGCGSGDLLRGMARQRPDWATLVGFDLSPGMANRAADLAQGLPARFFVGDAQALPFPDALFDVVMARHVLFYVPDIDQAVAEAARVLRPGGRLLATTNSAYTMPEYQAYLQRAAARFPNLVNTKAVTNRFSLEEGPVFLAPHFDRVETHTLHGALRFPAAQPFVDYVASTRADTMRPGHTDAEWQAILDLIRAEVDAYIARHGHLDVSKISGALVAVKKG
ncbi:MAG: methyltransferase domain-containing protein [Anaerolineae bacterium]|nr:methyltransferase domain-containing protein [Anaerolineae bacterium]